MVIKMNQVERKRQQIEFCSHALELAIFLLLARGLGSMGIAFIGVGLEVFLLIWSLCGGAVSDTLGRMLRSRNAKGQYKNAKKLRKSAMISQVVTGLLGTIFLIAGGRIPHFGFVLILIAPAMFLRGITAVLIGYFQGEGTELPRVITCLLRLIFLLGFGWMFGKMLVGYGEKVSALLENDLFTAMYGAGGIALAFTLGELFVVLFLLLLYKGSRKPGAKEDKDGLRATDSTARQIQMLYGAMWRRMGILFLECFPFVVSAFFLLKNSAERIQNADKYGVFLASYLLPILIVIMILGAALLPGIGKVVHFSRREEHRTAKFCFESGMHGVILYSLFFTVFGAIMAEQISACAMDGGAVGASYLQQGSVLLVFLMLFFYFKKTMLLLNQPNVVISALALGNVIYIGIIFLLGRMSIGGAERLVYAGLIGSGVSCLTLGALTCRRLRAIPDVLHILIMPAVAASIAGLLCLLLGKGLTPHVGNLAALIICLVTVAPLYLVIALLLRNVREQELAVIPFGKLLSAIGQLLRVF